MTASEAMQCYSLTHSKLMSLQIKYGGGRWGGNKGIVLLMEQQNLLRLSREVHGGDIGIETYRADSGLADFMVVAPQDEAKRNRWSYLRSLLHDKGLEFPEECAMAHMYIETGLGDPLEIVKELDAIFWLQCYTNYDPLIDKASLRQVKLRSRIDRQVQDEPMTEEKEGDHHKMAALAEWLRRRLDQGNRYHWTMDTESHFPPPAPEGVRQLLDKIDWGHILLMFAAEKLYRCEMEKQKQQNGIEGAGDLHLSEQRLREMLDLHDQPVYGQTHEPRIWTGIKGGPKLSVLLGGEFGGDWSDRVLEEARKRFESEGVSRFTFLAKVPNDS
ncbi:MAG: hypothetical protein J3Q66DRAFT_351978 [Benniella sp.]|nr:MAG: hypothetical protein J3Q66DRAFT_351978 [Benniella sp.]